jgi:hypothetical protein
MSAYTSAATSIVALYAAIFAASLAFGVSASTAEPGRPSTSHVDSRSIVDQHGAAPAAPATATSLTTREFTVFGAATAKVSAKRSAPAFRPSKPLTLNCRMHMLQAVPGGTVGAYGSVQICEYR